MGEQMIDTKTNIAVIGSRNWSDYAMIYNLIASFNPKTTRLYSGGALGVDTIAQECAERCGIECVVIEPEWDKYIPLKLNAKNPAGMIRNGEIIMRVEEVYVFWDGESLGTKDMIERAMKAKHITRLVIEKRSRD